MATRLLARDEDSRNDNPIPALPHIHRAAFPGAVSGRVAQNDDRPPPGRPAMPEAGDWVVPDAYGPVFLPDEFAAAQRLHSCLLPDRGTPVSLARARSGTLSAVHGGLIAKMILAGMIDRDDAGHLNRRA